MKSVVNRWGWRTRARRAAGFTLIELLVVFALIALIVGLVPIAFGRLHESAQYRDTVRAVLTELRAARALAQSSGADVRFAVNLPARSFGVEGAPPQHVPEPLVLRAVMAAEESGADGSMAIRFLPRGGASGGSVDLIRPSGSGVRLRVDWFSGRVEQEAIVP
ncbi:MAG: prepilin-type N-terminal cleavage/methylation domain-containing protein [Achromobacter sp.]|nr:prepilin-type N-terminal cleavage/methylation domain-containing protein [Achromobacter sp.]